MPHQGPGPLGFPPSLADVPPPLVSPPVDDAPWEEEEDEQPTKQGRLMDEQGRVYDVEMIWNDEEDDWGYVLYGDEDEPLFRDPTTGIPYTSLFEDDGSEVEIEIAPEFMVADFTAVRPPIEDPTAALRDRINTPASTRRAPREIETPDARADRQTGIPKGSTQPISVAPPMTDGGSYAAAAPRLGNRQPTLPISAVSPPSIQGDSGARFRGAPTQMSAGGGGNLLDRIPEVRAYLDRMPSTEEERLLLDMVIAENPSLLQTLGWLIGKARITDELLERDHGGLDQVSSHVGGLREQVHHVTRIQEGNVAQSAHSHPDLLLQMMQAVDEQRLLREGFDLSPATPRTEVGNPRLLGILHAMGLWYFQPFDSPRSMPGPRNRDSRLEGGAVEFVNRLMGRYAQGGAGTAGDYCVGSLDVEANGRTTQIYFLAPFVGQQRSVAIPTRREEIHSRMVQGLIDAMLIYDPHERKTITACDSTGYGPWVLTRRMMRQRDGGRGASLGNLIPDRERIYFIEPAWLAVWCGLHESVSRTRNVPTSARRRNVLGTSGPSQVGPLDTRNTPMPGAPNPLGAPSGHPFSPPSAGGRSSRIPRR